MTSGPIAYQPYTSVVNITATNNGAPVQATGVLISPDEVLTSEQAVYSSATGGIATNINVTSASQPYPVKPAGGYSGTVTYLANHTVPGPTDYNLDHRFAIIHLSSVVIGSAPMGVASGFGGGQVNATGYQAGSGELFFNNVETVAKDPGWSTLYGPGAPTQTTGAPLWIVGPDGRDDVVGLVLDPAGNPSTAAQITAEAATTIAQQVAADDHTPPTVYPSASKPAVSIYDTTTGAPVADTLSHAYTGPVPGVQGEYVNITPDSLNISTSTPNWFIHTGGGGDAIDVSKGGGNNVLDGSTGSNFLVGGTGNDTFFVDARTATADIWSTVSNFHSGDAATLWGISPLNFAFDWENNQGAAGATGLTLHATSPGKPIASLTLAGFNTADLSNGRIAATFGHDSASNSDFLYVKCV